MVIEFQCPGCSATLRVNSDFAGQQGKCQQCERPIIVPAASSEPLLLRDATPDDIIAELSRRDRSAVVAMFDTPESGTYDLHDLTGAKVRCYSTADMDDAKMLQALANLGRIAQGIDQKRGQPQAVDQSNLLEFKGDWLGMSLAEFKIKHKRKTGGIGVKLPWCSSDSPDQRIQGLLAEPWHTKCGIVHARIELPVENNSPTVAGVKTELFVYQFIDARLFRMSAFFDTDSFHVVREAISEKHGTPTSIEKDSTEFVWDKGVCSIRLVRGKVRPKRASMLHYIHNQLFQQMVQRSPDKSSDL